MKEMKGAEQPGAKTWHLGSDNRTNCGALRTISYQEQVREVGSSSIHQLVCDEVYVYKGVDQLGGMDSLTTEMIADRTERPDFVRV